MVLCGAPHTPDGCLSAEACRGAPAAPADAWIRVRGCEWKCLPEGCPPARPQGLLCRSGPPTAAGSSCRRPEAAGHRGAGGDSPWGGAGAARPSLPSEPGGRGYRDPGKTELRFQFCVKHEVLCEKVGINFLFLVHDFINNPETKLTVNH